MTDDDLRWAVLESLTRLDERRKSLGLSLRELARQAGLEPGFVFRALRKATSLEIGKEPSKWDIRSTTRLKLELALGFQPGGSFPSFEEIKHHAGER